MYLGHVFLASCCILSYEILLTRIFAVSQWNHLFFLVISIALFGLAASGTITALLSARANHSSGFMHDQRWPAALSSLQAVSIIGSYIGLNLLPLDYYRLSLEPIQLAYLLACYLMLTAPFLLAGLVISAAYATRPKKAGAIYFATMAGSATGAVIPLWLTQLLGEPVLVVVTALMPITILPLYLRASAVAASPTLRFQRTLVFVCLPVLLIALLSIYLFSTHGRPFIEIRSSEYKGLNQTLRFPDTRVVESHRRLQGHVDRVTGPYLRYAPGLSLNYQGRLPSQQVVFTDRDVPLTLYSGEAPDLTFSNATLSYSAYDYVDRVDRVLVIPQNGGLSLACALTSSAGEISIAIRHPDLARIVRKHYGLFVTTEHPRQFLFTASGGFDIIQIENWGSTIPGADALNQNHSLTIDAFEAYLKKLSPNGALTVSRRLILPPSDSLRLWATAHEALVRIGARNPMNHIAILRNWDTYTLLVAKSPLRNQARLLDFADRYGFDIVFLSQASVEMANRFNVLPQPHYFLGVNRLANAYATGNQQNFLNDYPLDVAPQTDLRPFPGRLLKWSGLRVLYRAIGNRFNSLFLSGEIVVGVSLIEALLVTVLLLLLPRRLITNRQASRSPDRGIYFFGIGCGFMLFEIYMIHYASFILGDAAVGFSVVVTALLAFSGLGGLLTQLWPLRHVRLIFSSLVVLFTLQFIGQIWLLDWILRMDAARRLVLVLVAMLPAGLLIGMPFPMGMQHMAPSASSRAYAWSINGCASVLSAILAAQLAISHGISSLLIGAIIAYGISMIGTIRFLRSHGIVDNPSNHDNKI